MEPQAPAGRSVTRYFLLLFGLCIPFWVIGATVDIELFPGFKLFQMGLAMPMVAAGQPSVGGVILRTGNRRRCRGALRPDRCLSVGPEDAGAIPIDALIVKYRSRDDLLLT